jgi:hypothetical protein
VFSDYTKIPAVIWQEIGFILKVHVVHLGFKRAADENWGISLLASIMIELPRGMPLYVVGYLSRL